MDWFYLILKMLALVLVIIIVYNFLKIYLLDKIKINKWIVLAMALIVYIAPNFFIENMGLFDSWWQYLYISIFIILFMWFLDLSGFNKKIQSKNKYVKTDKNKVIKSKAKPTRVKNSDMEVLKTKKKKNIFKK